jgi:Ca2+-transporting ATPase
LELKVLIFIIGILADLVLLALFSWLIKGSSHPDYIRTMMFAALGINSLFIVMACRSLKQPFFWKSLFANRFLMASILLSFLLLVLAIYLPLFQVLLKTRPLGVGAWLFLFGLGVFNYLAIELTKWVFAVYRQKA